MKISLAILSIFLMCETARASDPVCIQSHDSRVLSALAVTTCLEVVPDQSDNVVITKYIRQTVKNISSEAVELIFFENQRLQIPIHISDAGRNVTRPLPGLTEDYSDQDEKVFIQNYLILYPTDIVVRRYKIEELMTEVPTIDKKYTVSVGTSVTYRFLDESRLAAHKQRHLDFKQHQQWPETVWFRNVRLR